ARVVDRLRVGLATVAVATTGWALLQLPGPASSARYTATPPDRVTIAFARDIALLGQPPASEFAGVRGQLRRADVAIGNLEGTWSSGGSSKCGTGSSGCFAFQAPPQ